MEHELKRYALFGGGDKYYPNGGMKDLIDSFLCPSFARDYALKHCKELRLEWWQVADMETGEVVREWKSNGT